MIQYAEDLNYWDTTVQPGKSLGEIQDLLTDFGVINVIVTQGQSNGRLAWLIRFQWMDRTYRFLFTPLPCRWSSKVSSFGGKRRQHDEQARYQMGRIAVNFVKAILTAAQMNPGALFGFVEIPGTGGGQFPAIAAELDISGLVAALPDISIQPRLGTGDQE
jgi:hypothetical protein